MSCKYFILTKPTNKPVNQDEDNQITFLNAKTYVLPQTNIEYYISNGLFEKDLIAWTVQFCSKDKNMLDIGAHSGTYSISLADNCKHIYAFEPQKMTYYSLCGSIALSNILNVTCINYGLGSDDQVGVTTLNIVSLDGGGSTLHQNANQIIATEEIQIRTLDSFNLSNIGFIKMDVEENEIFVLQGAQNTLKKSNYPTIIFESNNTNHELFQYLKNLNYDIIQISGNYTNMYLANYKNHK